MEETNLFLVLYTQLETVVNVGSRPYISTVCISVHVIRPTKCTYLKCAYHVQFVANIFQSLSLPLSV
jgi:hypothetical protein